MRLKLWAGYGGKNSAWNFSGYYDGNAAFVVPLGWRVEATFQNLDANVPHSAGIVEAADSIPFSGDQATLAFPGATTRAFVAGVSSRIQPQVFKFEADRAGRFWVYCGVAGHGLNGMWIWFEVSADAQVPELRSYE